MHSGICQYIFYKKINLFLHAKQTARISRSLSVVGCDVWYVCLMLDVSIGCVYANQQQLFEQPLPPQHVTIMIITSTQITIFRSNPQLLQQSFIKNPPFRNTDKRILMIFFCNNILCRTQCFGNLTGK